MKNFEYHDTPGFNALTPGEQAELEKDLRTLLINHAAYLNEDLPKLAELIARLATIANAEELIELCGMIASAFPTLKGTARP